MLKIVNNTNTSVVEFIDPCGDGAGFDEVLMRTKSGKLIAYFESGTNRFLSILVDGNYRTTDQQACNFSVTGGFTMSKLSKQVEKLEQELRETKEKLEKKSHEKRALLINSQGFEKNITVSVDDKGNPHGPRLMIANMPNFNNRGRLIHYMPDRSEYELVANHGSLLVYREVI